MARANTRTWLPLDTWAKIFGFNPWLFNGFKQFPTTVGSTCEDVWFQGPEQGDKLSREDLAVAVQNAESQIAEFVGYNLMPDYDHETVPTVPFWLPTAISTRQSRHNRPKSTQVSKRYVWQVGTQTKKFLGQVAITRQDLDGDGFAETGVVDTGYANLDPNQLRIFYPDESGADIWEIRPVQYKGSGVVHIPMYQLPLRSAIEGYLMAPLDPQDANVYLTTVDVYQVYCDITQGPVLIYDQLDCDDPCYNVRLNSNCYSVQDKTLGFIKYNGAACTNCNTQYLDPSQIEIDYLSGWRNPRSVYSLVELDPYWHGPIAYLATNFFPKMPNECCDNNTVKRIEQWQMDYSLSISNEVGSKSHFATQFILENPFGLPTVGAFYAYNRAKGKRVA